MACSRRGLLTLLLGLAPAAPADRSQAKRSAKESRRRAKETKKRARQEVSDRRANVKERSQDRKFLNRDNAELDKARRQDLADLTKRRQAKTERVVFDATAPPEPKPEVKPATRGVEGAPAAEPKP
jgi:hypothetical protein